MKQRIINWLPYPVSANVVKYFMILLLRSFSATVWSVLFNGAPNTYSISSACITPIHWPHGLRLVRCNWRIKLNSSHFKAFLVYCLVGDFLEWKLISKLRWVVQKCQWFNEPGWKSSNKQVHCVQHTFLQICS